MLQNCLGTSVASWPAPAVKAEFEMALCIVCKGYPTSRTVGCCATEKLRLFHQRTHVYHISACVCSRLQLAPPMISLVLIDILLLSVGLPHKHQRLQNAAGHAGVPEPGGALAGPDHTHQVGHGQERGQERGRAEQEQIQGARLDPLLRQAWDCTDKCLGAMSMAGPATNSKLHTHIRSCA